MNGNAASEFVQKKRLTLILAAILYPLWWIVFKQYNPEFIDPIWERILLGVLGLLACTLSFYSQKIYLAIGMVTYFYTWIISFHMFHILALNHFHLLYLLFTFIAVLYISNSHESVRQLNSYFGLCFFVALLNHLTQQAQEIWIFDAVIVTSILASYVTTSARVKLVEQLQSSNLEMSKLLNLAKDQEMKLVYAEKMTMLGVMAGGIAHEINTPLQIVAGRARQIKILLHEEKKVNFKLVELCVSIENVAERISKIVKALRNFARNEEQDPMVHTSIADIVQNTVLLTQEKIKNQGVKLELSTIPPEWNIKCRENQITQVLMNLLDNASHAVAHLPEKWVKIIVKKDKKHFILSVIDSGRGIEKTVIDRIFTPFFTTKQVGEGTGLGLSISHTIITDHGGELTVDQTSPHTKFDIKLPF